MMRPTPAVVLLVSIFSMLSVTMADTPATQPTSRQVDSSTPMAFMVSYDQLAGQDPPAYILMYAADEDEDSQRLAHVQAKFDAEVGMLQKIVQQKWGDDGVDQLLHALGLKSLRDIQASTVKENGRHASVQFADGTPGPDLIRSDAGWRLDLTAFTKSLGMPVDDYLKQIRQLSRILPDVADGIAGDKLKDPSEMVSDIAKRLNPH